jgi:hypothetical protein
MLFTWRSSPPDRANEVSTAISPPTPLASSLLDGTSIIFENRLRVLMWENITHQEKGGIVSHVATCYIFYQSKIPDIEAGLASADRRYT